jgi:hypothetical protein
VVLVRGRAVLLLCPIACGPRSLQLPDQPEALSVILASDDGIIVAHDLDEPAVSVLVPEGRLVASFYRERLCALGLVAGEIELADDLGVALPAPLEVFERHGDQWEDAVAPSFRVPAVDPLACALRGGSFDADRCVTCPVPAMATEPDLELEYSFGACPAGWVERMVPEDEPRYRVCTPFPTNAIPECPPGMFPFIGGCGPIGVCPTDAIDLEDPSLVWVDAGAVGGDGTRAEPYGTIGEAIANSIGSVIAVQPGVYRERVALDGHRIVGVCAETVRIESPDVGPALTVTSTGTAEDVTIAGRATSAGTLVLRRSMVDGIDVIGRLEAQRIVVNENPNTLAVGPGGSAEVSEAILRGSSRFDGAASFSRSSLDAIVADSAELSLRECQIDVVSPSVALNAFSSTVSLDSVVFTTRDDQSVYAVRFSATASSRASLKRVFFDVVERAIDVQGGSSAVAEDVLVLRRAPNNLEADRIPTISADRSRLELRRSAIHGGGGRSVFATRSEVLVDSTIIRSAEVGLSVRATTASVTRSLIEDMSFIGAIKQRELTEEEKPTELHLDRTIIRRAAPCIQVEDQSVRLTTVLLEDCRGAAMVVSDAIQSDVVASDLIVRRVTPAETLCRACAGDGIVCDFGRIDLVRFVVEDPRATAIELDETCAGTLRDGVLRRAAVGIRAKAVPTLERIRFEDVVSAYEEIR